MNWLMEHSNWKMEIIQPYSRAHLWITIGCVLLAFLGAYFFQKIRISKIRKNHFTEQNVQQWQNHFICGVGIVLAVLEIYKQFFLTYVRNGNYSWSDFPFQLCSIGMYLCLVYSFLPGKWKKCVQTFFMTFGMLGGIVAFIEPTSSFHAYVTLTVQSLLWHTILLMLGLYFAMERRLQHNFLGKKELWLDFYGAMVLYIEAAVIAIVLNSLFCRISSGTMNLFFLGPSSPNAYLLNDIYNQLGPVAETMIFMTATVVGAGLLYLWHHYTEDQTGNEE